MFWFNFPYHFVGKYKHDNFIHNTIPLIDFLILTLDSWNSCCDDENILGCIDEALADSYCYDCFHDVLGWLGLNHCDACCVNKNILLYQLKT